MDLQNNRGSIPDNHAGADYVNLMSDISRKRSTKRYLEIGVNTGYLLEHIHTDLAICVDPEFRLKENITRNKNRLMLHQVTSDAFFADAAALQAVGGPFDLAFLDGMHVFEYLLRDFFNTEANCHRGSLIAMHDCLPLNAEMTHRVGDEAMALGQDTNHPNHWTGDVWKIIPILKEYRPDLRVICVDSHPTGIVFVTNLDPSKKILQSRYLEIVDKYAKLSSDYSAIQDLYSSVELVPASRLMHEFDHSLYFKI